MKQDIAEKWIAALESSDYKQTKGRLRDSNDGMCCLGVLCNLHAQEHPEIAVKQKRKGQYMGNEALPPSLVSKKWAGMKNSDGWVPALAKSLAKLNDEGQTFKQIAKLIRKHWKDL